MSIMSSSCRLRVFWIEKIVITALAHAHSKDCQSFISRKLCVLRKVMCLRIYLVFGRVLTLGTCNVPSSLLPVCVPTEHATKNTIQAPTGKSTVSVWHRDHHNCGLGVAGGVIVLGIHFLQARLLGLELDPPVVHFYIRTM